MVKLRAAGHLFLDNAGLLTVGHLSFEHAFVNWEVHTEKEEGSVCFSFQTYLTTEPQPSVCLFFFIFNHTEPLQH